MCSDAHSITLSKNNISSYGFASKCRSIAMLSSYGEIVFTASWLKHHCNLQPALSFNSCVTYMCSFMCGIVLCRRSVLYCYENSVNNACRQRSNVHDFIRQFDVLWSVVHHLLVGLSTLSNCVTEKVAIWDQHRAVQTHYKSNDTMIDTRSIPPTWETNETLVIRSFSVFV